MQLVLLTDAAAAGRASTAVCGRGRGEGYTALQFSLCVSISKISQPKPLSQLFRKAFSKTC